MENSSFMDKDIIPDDFMLSKALGSTFNQWIEIRNYVMGVYPAAIVEWNFPGAKYGWNCRIKDKKRAIVYLLPREGYFLAALVFGQKASSEALQSEISPDIKQTIESARVYAEGRGFNIEIRDVLLVEDIKKLIDIKLAF